MIEVAKQRSNPFANTDFQVADVLQQDFKAETFDVIVSIATLHDVPVERLLPHLKAAGLRLLERGKLE
jgi:ubiquinone/menaquinone biosynthesis C-methylase UbiE